MATAEDLAWLRDKMAKAMGGATLPAADAGPLPESAPRTAAPKGPGRSISKAESAGAGATQGVSAGFADEILGALNAIYPATPPAPGNDTSTAGERYTQMRDVNRVADDEAREANPKTYIASEIGGGVASALIPGGAPATLGKAIRTGAAQGAVFGLGNSRADLTEGDVRGAAIDTVAGAGIGAAGGALGHGVAKGVELARTLPARLSKDKMLEGLGKFMESITKRSGDPATQKALAGKMIEKAGELAGDTPVSAQPFISLADELAQMASQRRFSTKIDPVADEIIASAERLAKTKNVTLRELSEGLKDWTARVDDLANDPASQRLAILAKKALNKSLDDATGNTMLGEAAQLLGQGRTQYARGARNQELQQLLTKSIDPVSKGGEVISPRRLATLSSGKNAKAIEKLLADDPKALESWKMGIEAARRLATGGDRWLPKQLIEALPEPVTKGFDALMRSRGAIKAFTDPRVADDFRRLVSAERSPGVEEATAIIGRITARLSLDDAPPVKLKAVAEEDTPRPSGETAQGGEFRIDPTNLQGGGVYPPKGRR